MKDVRTQSVCHVIICELTAAKKKKKRRDIKQMRLSEPRSVRSCPSFYATKKHKSKTAICGWRRLPEPTFHSASDALHQVTGFPSRNFNS